MIACLHFNGNTSGSSNSGFKQFLVTKTKPDDWRLKKLSTFNHCWKLNIHWTFKRKTFICSHFWNVPCFISKELETFNFDFFLVVFLMYWSFNTGSAKAFVWLLDHLQSVTVIWTLVHDSYSAFNVWEDNSQHPNPRWNGQEAVLAVTYPLWVFLMCR